MRDLASRALMGTVLFPGTMMGLGGFSAPFTYSPNLAPVGSGAAYFPGDVSQDAAALNYLGYLADADYAQLAPSTGTQAGDIGSDAGAWDPSFRGAIAHLQTDAGITVDTWVGPQTRTAIAAKVLLANANPGTTPSTPPAGVVPANPGSVPANPAVIPGVTPTSGTSTQTYVLAGAGILVVGGLLYYALS